MSHRSTNQGRRRASSGSPPDAHGQAALLLAESMLHGLLDKGILRTDEAIAIVATVTEIEEEMVANRDDSAAISEESLGLLARIAASLELDRPDEGAETSQPSGELHAPGQEPSDPGTTR